MKVPPKTSCYIHRIATATPEFTIDARRSAELFSQACRDSRTQRLLPRLVRLSTVERRHAAALDPRFGPGGVEALYRPLSEQPHGPGMGARTELFEKVTAPLMGELLAAFPDEELAGLNALITASCTHASAPGLERPIFQHSRVPFGVDRWNLGFMGCSAGLAALRMTHQMAQTQARTLIVACEICSLHFQYTDALDQLTANVLFADGAAAVTTSPDPALVRIVDCRCAAVPSRADQMVWLADDHGLRLTLSQELPDTLAECVPDAVASFLAASDRTVSSVDHWVVHPGGPQILDAVEESLHLSLEALERSRSVLRRYGNMSSPTVFFILNELLAAGAHGSCVMMAFGPGLTVEMVLLDLARG